MLCTVVRTNLPPDQQCTAEAVAWLTCACIHEHMDRDAICGSCLITVRVLLRLGEVMCAPCKNSSQPHPCRVLEVREERFSVPA